MRWQYQKSERVPNDTTRINLVRKYCPRLPSNSEATADAVAVNRFLDPNGERGDLFTAVRPNIIANKKPTAQRYLRVLSAYNFVYSLCLYFSVI